MREGQLTMIVYGANEVGGGAVLVLASSTDTGPLAGLMRLHASPPEASPPTSCALSCGAGADVDAPSGRVHKHHAVSC